MCMSVWPAVAFVHRAQGGHRGHQMIINDHQVLGIEPEPSRRTVKLLPAKLEAPSSNSHSGIC